MTTIKFGTDGWRAIIAKDYTVDNVARVTDALAQWLLQRNKTPKVVLGHDCRFGGNLFANTVAKVLASNNIKVILAPDFVSTPMISLATLRHSCDVGVVITASHNPPDYNGFKIKGSYGGPLLPNDIEAIEELIPLQNKYDLDVLSLKDFEAKGLVEYKDLESEYCKHVEDNFDLDAIRNSGMNFAYDAMYGAGQNVIRRLLPDTTFLHCDSNPSFEGQAPEPIHKNLSELSELIKLSGDINSGLATDGDADRIGLYDENGVFVDSHHIILLLIHYLYKHKGFTGKVCITFSVSPRVIRLCELYNLPYQVVKIGFKYICEVMLNEDMLLGGEESGGIAIKGHIPERDGIWMGLTIWEFMSKTGKKLSELIDEVYGIVGRFYFDRSDLHLTEEQKQKALAICQSADLKAFGSNQFIKKETIDGYKYWFNDSEWLMIRASGTEPVLRTYAEADSNERVQELLKACEQTLRAGF